MNLYYNKTFKSIKNVFWFAYNSLNKTKYFLYEIQVIFIPSHFSYLLLKWDIPTPCYFQSGTHICIVVKCKGRNNIDRGKEYNKNQSQNKLKTKLSRFP